MSSARGFSLVEMLASAALMTLIAAASLPLVVGGADQNTRSFESSGSAAVDLQFRLGAFADDYISTVEVETVNDLQLAPVTVHAWVSRTGASNTPPIRIGVEETGSSRWFVFTCGELAISRWAGVRPDLLSEEQEP